MSEQQIVPPATQGVAPRIAWTVTSGGTYVPIQYDVRHRPLWVLGACILLAATKRDMVRPLLDELMPRYRSPRLLAMADRATLARLLAPGGFQHQKAHRLRGMAADYCRYRAEGIRPDRLAIESFFGCGPYAADAWELFVLRRMPERRPLSDSVLETFARSPLCAQFLATGRIEA